jgi:pimeloyl-ACP methyl ester carboxylesterase
VILEHTTAAHELIEGSRPELFDDTGPFPHVEHPHRCGAVLAEFLATTPRRRHGRLCSLC